MFFFSFFFKVTYVLGLDNDFFSLSYRQGLSK